MNRQLFISDSRRLFRQHGEGGYHEAMADYVAKIPADPQHAICLPSVHKDKVIGLCCKHFEVPLSDMAGKTRITNIRYKRQATIYLLVTRTRMTQKEIAGLFHRDHSTICYTKGQIRDLMESDSLVREEITCLNAQL